MNGPLLATPPPDEQLSKHDLFLLSSCRFEKGFTCFFFTTRTSNKALGLDFTEGSCEMLRLDKLCVLRRKGSELRSSVVICCMFPDAHRRRYIGIMSTGSCVDMRFLTDLVIEVINKRVICARFDIFLINELFQVIQ